jgi:hypothetical protein
MNDVIYHFDNLYKKIDRDDILSKCDVKIFNSYIANAVLDSYKNLSKENRKQFRQQILNKKIVNLLLEDTVLRKIKKLIYKLII